MPANDQESKLRSAFLRAAFAVIRDLGEPLSAKEIVAQARERGLLPGHFSGKTPSQTLKSKLSTHITQHGGESLFVRTAPGRFFLRELLVPPRKEYVAARLKPPEPQEHVLVAPLRDLRSLGVTFQGVKTSWKRLLARITAGDRCHYIERSRAESRDDLKQVVTFVLVRRGDQFLTFRRGTYTRAAGYLQGTRCVGFGGHVSYADNTLFENDLSVGDLYGIRNNAIRELGEELLLPRGDLRRLYNPNMLKVAGLLNDDASSVGRRHLAVVFVYETSSDASWEYPRRGEKAVTQLAWLPSFGVKFDLSDFDYWSQLCLRALSPRLLAKTPALTLRKRPNLAGPHIICLTAQLGGGSEEVAAILEREYGYEILPSDDTRSAPERLVFVESEQDSLDLRAAALPKGHEIVTAFCHSPFDRRYRRYKALYKRKLPPEGFAGLASTSSPGPDDVLVAQRDITFWDWGGRRAYSYAVRALMETQNDR